jgi:thioredoxin 1
MLAVGLLAIFLGVSCPGDNASALPSARDHPAADLTILFFTASWCEPCHAVQPILEKFAQRHPKQVRLVSVDFDQSRGEATRWEVHNIPVVILLSSQGRILLRADGAERKTLRGLSSALEDALKRAHERS